MTADSQRALPLRRKAKAVFEASRVRATPHQIAAKTGVEIRTAMFWLIVFRIHGLVEEIVVMGRHLYAGRFGLSDPTGELTRALSKG